jgi:hypothetical protein
MPRPSGPAWFDRPRKAKIIYNNSHNMDYNNHTLLFLLLKRYSLLWTLASNTILLTSHWYLTVACLFFFIPIIFKSSSSSSFHILRGPPPLIVPFYSHHCNLFWHSLVLHSFNMTHHLNRRDFINFTVQYLIWLNSNHMCDVSVTIAAVTKEQCPCDVSCCLAMD